MAARDIVIAMRRVRLSRGGTARVLTAKIGVPRRVGTGEWACPYWITGFGDGATFRARGVDSVQALVLALEGVRIELKKAGGRISWVGERGTAGFPRYVPDYYGQVFSERLEGMIDRELLRFARAAEARHKRKPRSQRDKS